jgi:hypothetical protein
MHARKHGWPTTTPHSRANAHANAHSDAPPHLPPPPTTTTASPRTGGSDSPKSRHAAGCAVSVHSGVGHVPRVPARAPVFFAPHQIRRGGAEAGVGCITGHRGGGGGGEKGRGRVEGCMCQPAPPSTQMRAQAAKNTQPRPQAQCTHARARAGHQHMPEHAQRHTSTREGTRSPTTPTAAANPHRGPGKGTREHSESTCIQRHTRARGRGGHFFARACGHLPTLVHVLKRRRGGAVVHNGHAVDAGEGCVQVRGLREAQVRVRHLPPRGRRQRREGRAQGNGVQ